ncbi:MAG: hypothetical protein GXP02_05660 [Alphaproteobacteria bacterium]|nr:hypothetical protein [Alphaproteobacteria bacterium]
MIRLVNGLIFGLGLGLITTAADGLAGGHNISVYVLGTALLFTSVAWVLSRRHQAR